MFFAVLESCQKQLCTGKRFRFKNKLLSMDATFVQLCLSLFPWAHFRSTKGAVKLHMLYDHDGYFPVFCHVTDGKCHEVRIARQALADPELVPAGSIVVFDRAYLDFSLFAQLTENHAFYVTRLKERMRWTVTESWRVPEHRNILRDDDVRFLGATAARFGQQMVRMVETVDPETGASVVLLTNNWQLGASTIARIYRDRWQIEVFFKTLKQHLKIKTFVGTSENALLVQIWTALIGVLALKLLKSLSSFSWSMSNLVAMVRLNLFTYRDLLSWISSPYEIADEPVNIQLSFGFP
jgi:transposase